MGRVHSVMRWSGKVGDYVYYMLNGKEVIRRVAKKRRGPKTQGEKERALHNAEFGRASVAGKWLRAALAAEYNSLSDPLLYQRINRLMTQLKNCHAAPTGERNATGGLATVEGQQVFSHFLFHKKPLNFPQLLSAARRDGRIRLQQTSVQAVAVTLIELQLNFNSGAFRRHEHHFPDGLPEGEVFLKRKFRSRMDLLIL